MDPFYFAFVIAVCDEKFFMIGFMSYYNLPDEGYLPCELGAVEYSLNGGILRRLHYFIPPGLKHELFATMY